MILSEDYRKTSKDNCELSKICMSLLIDLCCYTKLIYSGLVSEELPTSDQQLSAFTCFNDKSKLVNREGKFYVMLLHEKEYIILILITEKRFEERDVS